MLGSLNQQIFFIVIFHLLFQLLAVGICAIT